MTAAVPETPDWFAYTAKDPRVRGVNRPVGSMDPPVASQEGESGRRFPFASWPVAVNCRVSSTVRVVVAGLTRIVARAPGVTMTVAVPAMGPWEAVMGQVPTDQGVKRPAASMVPLPAAHKGAIVTGFPFAS